MLTIGKPPATRQGWLESLCRRLAWAFPEPQAKEILADYQEQFDEGRSRGKSDGEIIEALGAPREAVAQLLEEDPAARIEQLRYTLLWVAAAVVCWAFGWFCLYGYSDFLRLAAFCAVIPMMASTLFMLMRGPARIAMERLVPPEKPVSQLGTFWLLGAAMLICTLIQEAVFIAVMRLHVILMEYIGYPVALLLLLFIITMLALAAWFLLRSVTMSIGYFPGVVHALGGAAGSALFMLRYYVSMDVEPSFIVPPEVEILTRLAPYFVGLFTALAFQRWIDGRKPLPWCFQARAVTWTDWRRHLGVNLLGWYDLEQAGEIIADYQERFEMGRERGRSEDSLLSEFGRPTAVTRALLQEDRTARLRSRKAWLWGIPLLLSVWFLVRLLLSYCFGSIFTYAIFDHLEGCLFLLLGAVSLFALLHGRGRAVLEKKFPAGKGPAVWAFLLPLVCAAVIVSWTVYSIAHPEVEFIGHAIPWILMQLLECSMLAMFALLLWTLARCTTRSIWYFPAAVHAAGGLAGMLTMLIMLQHRDIASFLPFFIQYPFVPESLQVFLPVPYFLGVLLAAVFWAVLRAVGKRG